MSRQTDLRKLSELIKDIKFSMLTTVNDDGSLWSRPMAAQKIRPRSFDGKLWFFTKKDTAKIHSIEKDQHVNVSFAHPTREQFVSISGKGRHVGDKSKMNELWSPTLRAWFPMGIDDPDICLIEVDIDSAEIWDSPPNTMVKIAGLLKARLTGRPLERDTFSKHMDLQRSH